ncbi:Phosphoglycerate mutase family protein [Neofusicoccum parvum]|uniref:Phosphoglycerate mutase family protein n=1 Tax=Neofusicoccum parvum TaxID=310453 RepID=A0ACB5RUF3_9PEZI|nr:Phosphoglycerate mutase family protein [Neofusicoccum parvum]
MPPIIHCVRHAQAYHNLGTPEHNHSLRDPALTDLGKQQCAALRAAFPHHARVSTVVASPLRRTLWTALLAFGPGVRVVALPEIQENSGLPCDVGGERGALEREFAGLPAAADLDFALVADGWNVKAGPWAAEAGAVAERCRRARVRLREMVGEGEGGEVVAVTHGGLLHSFTEDWSDFDRHDGTAWANTEFRSYTFAPDGGEQASLVETEESLKRRGGTRLTKEDQLKLKRRAEKEWDALGYQLLSKSPA